MDKNQQLNRTEEVRRSSTLYDLSAGAQSKQNEYVNFVRESIFLGVNSRKRITRD